jgi:hypothetical protein
MATRKPGFQDTNGTRNRRQNRYGNAGADNDTDYRLTGGPPTNNRVRNRFTDMPRVA